MSHQSKNTSGDLFYFGKSQASYLEVIILQAKPCLTAIGILLILAGVIVSSIYGWSAFYGFRQRIEDTLRIKEELLKGEYSEKNSQEKPNLGYSKKG